MVFREEEIQHFKALFEERKPLIRNFEGRMHLQLWQDRIKPQIFFTYCWWDTEDHLNAYRPSHFFDDMWSLTKQTFAAKPKAWTVDALVKM